MKKENRKLNKKGITEITGSRDQLKEFMGRDLLCNCFVTNTEGYLGGKRLITEIKIPETDYMVKHVWVKSSNVSKLEHGYHNLNFKVTEYQDQVTHLIKYSLRFTDKRYYKTFNTKTSKKE